MKITNEFYMAKVESDCGKYSVEVSNTTNVDDIIKSGEKICGVLGPEGRRCYLTKFPESVNDNELLRLGFVKVLEIKKYVEYVEEETIFEI